jgi:hypothetical protein
MLWHKKATKTPISKLTFDRFYFIRKLRPKLFHKIGSSRSESTWTRPRTTCLSPATTPKPSKSSNSECKILPCWYWFFVCVTGFNKFLILISVLVLTRSLVLFFTAVLMFAVLYVQRIDVIFRLKNLSPFECGVISAAKYLQRPAK